MSILRRASFLGFALAPLVVLAACGGNGDSGDVDDGTIERPAPGEYLFDIEATIEITLTEPAVSAAAGMQETHSGMGTGTATVNVAEPPEGGDGEVISGYFGGMKLEVTIRGGDNEFPIEIIQPPGEDSAPWRMSRGTSAVPSVLTELQPFTLAVSFPEGDTLTNADSVPLESNEGVDLTEAFDLRMPGLVPDLEPIRLQDEDGMVKGEITSVLLELTPTNDQVETGDDEEAEPPDEPVLIDTDTIGDATECASGAAVEDDDVDILAIDFIQRLDGVAFRVHLVKSPLESKDWFSFSVQVQIGQEGSFQVGQYEVHDKEPNSGRLDSTGKVEAGSEGDVTATDEFVTFFFPGLVIQEGDTVTARAFHLKTADDTVNCDVTNAFPLSDLIAVPCGGKCTPVP